MTARRTLIQLSVTTMMYYRTIARQLGLLLAFVVLFPLGFLFFLGIVIQPTLKSQVLVGAIMMEIALLNINVVAQNFGSDKQTKIYDLWVSLPIHPISYVLAGAFALLPFSLLSAGLTLLIGSLFFGLHFGGLILPLFGALLLVWGSTLGIGFLIGAYGTSPRQINQVAQFVGIVMTFFAPIFYPVSALPPIARDIAYVWPLTWGSLLLSGLLEHEPTQTLQAIVVLVAFTLVWVVLMVYGLRWRRV